MLITTSLYSVHPLPHSRSYALMHSPISNTPLSQEGVDEDKMLEELAAAQANKLKEFVAKKNKSELRRELEIILI